ncbi:MAG: hypothetical protein A3I78_10615 [Gammaproteobacteria bacterium RIFCSPLOWO2_02_FULL_56_15]|nr:MAG: hypothetical protein A3I78_10615 [Gammaproteobacteria bacterium RIFCSPLOWO2_02_FULL_56_15]
MFTAISNSVRFYSHERIQLLCYAVQQMKTERSNFTMMSVHRHSNLLQQMDIFLMFEVYQFRVNSIGIFS